MDTSDGHQDDGAAAATSAPSAFDRLFHRLVVAGDRPVVRKKKLRKIGKPLVPAATAPPLPTPVELPDHRGPDEKQVGDVAPTASAGRAPVDVLAVASVRRLRLCRSIRRRLSGLSRDAAIQALAGSGNLQKVFDPVLRQSSQIQLRGRRRRCVATPVLSPSDLARRFLRLETIAARLYDQHAKARIDPDPAAPACTSSEWRVLHDFCFPLADTRTRHSRAHYETGRPRETTAAQASAVPVAPQISW